MTHHNWFTGSKANHPPAGTTAPRLSVRRLGLTVTTGALVALVMVATTATASVASSVAVPPTPIFSGPVETYPKWTSEKGCLAGVRPGVLATVNKVLHPTYGGANWRYLTQRACAPASESGHDNGTALDWMQRFDKPSEKAHVEAFMGWLLATDQQGNPHAMARRLGIMYLIWNDKVFKLYRAHEGWTTYTRTVQGVRTPCTQLRTSEYDTVCHRDHLHISFTPAGAAMATSFWKQSSTSLPTPPAPSQPAPNEPASQVPANQKLWITNPVVNAKRGSTVTVQGTTAEAGQRVQVYIRRPEHNWVAIGNPVTSTSTGVFSVSYPTSVTHYVQMRVGTTTSNLGRVIVN